MNFKNNLDRVLEFKSDKYPITSLYLKLGPGERENFKYRIIIKNLIKEQKDSLNKRDFKKSALESIESDYKKIADYIENPDQLTGCRGLAIFSSAREGIWEIFKLPFVYRSRLVVDQSPLVRQLVTMNEEFGDIAVVIIDRKKARLFRIGLDGGQEVLGYFYPDATRATKFQAQEGKSKQRVTRVGGGEISHGYGEYGFQRMIENEMHQHYKNVSQKLFDYYKESRFDWLVIGGVEQLITDFLNHLHTYLKGKFLGNITAEINLVKPDELTERVLDLLEAEERRNEKSLVKEFEQKLISGLAVNGLEATLKAFMIGQVRLLLVLEEYRRSGFKCPESGVLVLEGRDSLCPEGKKPIPVVDIVDDVIEEALVQNVEVEMILDEGAKKKINGIGALLRFKL
ncbi:MAG: peptide chain release factor 1 [Candidatus Dadabacteria bacterium]|nr:peptide chain release factor 1 [Candidatus Dadabacteria bacterium]